MARDGRVEHGRVLVSGPGAALVVTGSLVFIAGAALGVPRVFTTSDPAQRRALLARNSVRWRAAQPLYAAGPLLAAVGVGLLGSDGDPTIRPALVVASASLFAGAVAWAWACADRARRYLEFAVGSLPAWPFRGYVVLTLAGLAVLGVALLLGAGPLWVAWAVLVADAAFVAGYVWTGDIPPFVFYLLLLVVGLAV